MKKIVAIISLIFLITQGCNGQAEKNELEATNKKYISFEEKQKKASVTIVPTKINPLLLGFNFRYAAKKATPAVVHIKSVFLKKTEREIPDFLKEFFGDDFMRRYFEPGDRYAQKQLGSASGVIVSDDGYIVTNNHVVNGADSIEIVLYDQRSYPAKLIGTDPTTDLALLKINETQLAFIEFGNSDSVEVGDIVLAVGNPFNLASTVTSGIVSAKARNINILTDRSAVESYIQTDAAVNRGNSGGALVDINGKLIGINAAIATPTGVYAGYSFAIPVEIIKKTINDLLRYGKIMRAYIGLIMSNMDAEKAKLFGLKNTNGVLADSIIENGAAAKAGLQKKDIIINVDKHIVESAPQLLEIIARHRPGEVIQLTINRYGKEKTIPITLLATPDSKPPSLIESEVLKNLGIELENLSEKEKIDLKISGGVKVATINKGVIVRQTNMQEGFVITKVNRKPINNISDFVREVNDKKGGILLEGIYPSVAGAYFYAFGL